MKVILRKPPAWISPYTISRDIIDFIDEIFPFKDFKKQESLEISIRNFLERIPFFSKACKSLSEFFEKQHKHDIRIDYWDIWGLDTSLARIIVPSLRLLKERKDGCPFVDDEDYPHDILISDDVSDQDLELKGLQIRWEFVLDEMIYAFEQVVNDDNYEPYNDPRVLNGLRLFGKYYFSLWS
jgi:hypothetical protein